MKNTKWSALKSSLFGRKCFLCRKKMERKESTYFTDNVCKSCGFRIDEHNYRWFNIEYDFTDNYYAHITAMEPLVCRVRRRHSYGYVSHEFDMQISNPQFTLKELTRIKKKIGFLES